MGWTKETGKKHTRSYGNQIANKNKPPEKEYYKYEKKTKKPILKTKRNILHPYKR